MLNRTMTGLALLGAGLWTLQQLMRTHRARLRPVAKPAPLQTWESEGGAVPVDDGHTAGAVTPDRERPA